MKQATKLTSQEQEQLAQTKSQQTTAREFPTVEEALRHDADETVVPPAIAKRLDKSIQNMPPPERSWWQRVFGR